MFKAAVRTFDVHGHAGEESFNYGKAVDQALEPNRVTVCYFESDRDKLCLIASHTLTHTFGLYNRIRAVISRAMDIRPDQVVTMSSHNHCSVRLSWEPQSAFWGEYRRDIQAELTTCGREFFAKLEKAARGLANRTVPVTVSWAMGHERRIHYNRKGRRADGTTYFMREEERLALGKDFNGDIDDHAPVIVLHDERGDPVLVLLHFNAHPATAFHPEHPIVCGEYAQVACDIVSEHLARRNGPVPVAFLQGCAGDMNSKGLLTSDLAWAKRQGKQLAETYVKALRSLKPSASQSFGFARDIANVPLSRFPSLAALKRERAELEDFVRRAKAGDEDTLSCVGLNFTSRLSPLFRAKLVAAPMKWNSYAMKLRRSGEADRASRFLEMETCVFRLGDVAVVGMPGEPFVGVARQVRRQCIAPLTIPCGYTNISFGYLPDGPNCGDREYMSSFYRYTRHPDYRKPAGDVLARTGAQAVNRLFEAND